VVTGGYSIFSPSIRTSSDCNSSLHTAFCPGQLNMWDSSQELWLLVYTVTFNKIGRQRQSSFCGNCANASTIWIPGTTCIFNIRSYYCLICSFLYFFWGNVQTSSNTYKYSSFPRTIKDWNNLPSHLLNMDDVEAFKTSLAKKKLLLKVANIRCFIPIAVEIFHNIIRK
jgi:hypothetical protein